MKRNYLTGWIWVACISLGIRLPAQAPVIEPLTDVTARALTEINQVPGYPGRDRGVVRVPEVIGPAISAVASHPNWDTAEKRLQLVYELTGREDYAATAQQIGSWNIRWLPSWPNLAPDSLYFSGLTSSRPDIQLQRHWVEPRMKSFVLERAGDVHPKLISVTYPEHLGERLRERPSEAAAMPFLVYYHPTLGQATSSYNTAENLKSQQDGNYYPYGWDFLFHVFWKYLSYRGYSVNMEYSMGLAYQLAASGKDVVLIIPVLSKQDAINVGDFNDPGKSLDLLRSIQQFVATQERVRPAADVGRVALAGFSNGNNMVTSMLARNHLYLRQFVKEAYMFDAPATPGVSWINAAKVWAGTDTSKVIRIYAQSQFVNSRDITGGAALRSGIAVNHPARPWSVALLDRPYWSPLVQIHEPSSTDYFQSRTYWAIHSMIPATMLTDALSRSRF
ncbi:MAG: hypothetical protein EAZ89_05645 [Bacteroidetes bacterium]|nr:MAG: hypothetical protein EAZ89_05645 [Bacteroidota bacterium]